MLKKVGENFITGARGAAGSTASDFHASGKYHFFHRDESLYSKYLCFRCHKILRLSITEKRLKNNERLVCDKCHSEIRSQGHSARAIVAYSQCPGCGVEQFYCDGDISRYKGPNTNTRIDIINANHRIFGVCSDQTLHDANIPYIWVKKPEPSEIFEKFLIAHPNRRKKTKGKESTPVPINVPEIDEDTKKYILSKRIIPPKKEIIITEKSKVASCDKKSISSVSIVCKKCKNSDTITKAELCQIIGCSEEGLSARGLIFFSSLFKCSKCNSNNISILNGDSWKLHK